MFGPPVSSIGTVNLMWKERKKRGKTLVYETLFDVFEDPPAGEMERIATSTWVRIGTIATRSSVADEGHFEVTHDFYLP